MDRRRNAVYIIIVLSLIAGLITGRGLFFNVAYAFIGLLIFSFIWAWTGASWLRLRRHTRARRAQVGHKLDEVFTVQNTGVLPKLWLEVYDQSSLPGHHASHVVSNLWPRAEASWKVQTMCVQRGIFQLGPLRVVTGDPFGLFHAERQISATSPLVVYPPTIDIYEFAMPVGSLPGGEALRQRAHQVTTNAAGVRDYVPGDSFNRIHWRSTARKNRMIVKEFELDPLADVWVLLDADRSVHEGDYDATPEFIEWMLEYNKIEGQYAIPPTTEEYAVTVCASLVRYFLQKDRTVGFATHGIKRHVVQADRGPRQLTKILEALAVTEARNTFPFEQLMLVHGEQMARGTTVVLVTPSSREGWILTAQGLLQRGLRVIAVLVDAESFGGRPGTRLTESMLMSIRIPTYVVKKDDDLRVILNSSRF